MQGQSMEQRRCSRSINTPCDKFLYKLCNTSCAINVAELIMIQRIVALQTLLATIASLSPEERRSELLDTYILHPCLMIATPKNFVFTQSRCKHPCQSWSLGKLKTNCSRWSWTAYSMISETTYHLMFSETKLKCSDILLKSYTVERIPVLRQLNVHVHYGGKSAH